MKGQRIVLDTNVWISYIIKRQLDKLVIAKYDYELTFLSCRELLNGLTDVLQRPKLKEIIGDNHLQFIQFHQYHCLSFAIPEKLPQYNREIIPDKKDIFLFDLAATSKAAYIVTGDRALLDIEHQIPYLKVIGLSEFRRTTRK